MSSFMGKPSAEQGTASHFSQNRPTKCLLENGELAAGGAEFLAPG
jgi:hypothetical protein